MMHTLGAAAPFRVVFVCTGNICRSPMAEVVFRHLADASGHGARVATSSAATGDWHVGERGDDRTLAALQRRGYDGSRHRARQFTADTFEVNDLVIALDRSHERILRGWARTDEDSDKVALLQGFVAHPKTLDVPDPYYAAAAMFDDVLGMIEEATTSLFHQLEPALRSGSRIAAFPSGASS